MLTCAGISKQHFQCQPLEVLRNTHLLGGERGERSRENITKGKLGLGGALCRGIEEKKKKKTRSQTKSSEELTVSAPE